MQVIDIIYKMKLLIKFGFQLLGTFKLIQKILEFNFFRVCIQNMIKYTINIYDKNNVNIFLQSILPTLSYCRGPRGTFKYDANL